MRVAIHVPVAKREYILGKILQFDKSKEMFKIMDEDDKGVTWDKPIQGVIPVPTLQQINLNERRRFEFDEEVLAVFPQTTCFYQGVVKQKPSRNHAKYGILFDDENEVRMIVADLVIPGNI